MLATCYVVLQRVLQLISLLCRSSEFKELEIVVFTGGFDAVFEGQHIRILRTPIQPPEANGIAERFVRTARAECLDWLLILNARPWSAR